MPRCTSMPRGSFRRRKRPRGSPRCWTGCAPRSRRKLPPDGSTRVWGRQPANHRRCPMQQPPNPGCLGERQRRRHDWACGGLQQVPTFQFAGCVCERSIWNLCCSKCWRVGFWRWMFLCYEKESERCCWRFCGWCWRNGASKEAQKSVT